MKTFVLKFKSIITASCVQDLGKSQKHVNKKLQYLVLSENVNIEILWLLQT